MALGVAREFIRELKRIQEVFEQAATEAKKADDALAFIAACRVKDQAIEDLLIDMDILAGIDAGKPLGIVEGAVWPGEDDEGSE